MKKTDQHHVLSLSDHGKVVHGELQYHAWRRLPVWIRLLPHVGDNLSRGPGAAVLLSLDSLPEEDQCGETLDKVLLGKLSLLCRINLNRSCQNV